MIESDKAVLERSIGILGETAVKLGLNPPAVDFEVVPASVMYGMAAYHFPGRFSHWTYGREYYRQKTRYDLGLSRIYELVINTEPVHAFLMENNPLVAQKLVIAHVLGHADFFRRNIYFKESNRRMDITAAAHADLVKSLERKQGWEEVEQVLDAALSIANHVDPASGLFRRKSHDEYEKERLYPAEKPVSGYDDIWNLTGSKKETVKKERKTPAEPQKDILLFLAEQSHQLEDWQRVLLHLVREEWIYFFPNMRTKIMNEGYAAFWHERILENSPITADEHIDFRRMHTGVVSSGHGFSTNPYLVGYKLWRDIEKRWDGEAEEEEKTWYGESVKKGGRGMKKVFEVASQFRDADFIRNFLTEKLVRELDLYAYHFKGDVQKKEGQWVTDGVVWQKVRDTLADQLTSLGIPAIMVEDGDFKRRGELLLTHDFGSDSYSLDLDYAGRTLRHVYKLWGRPVHLTTKVEGQKNLITCTDGNEIKIEAVS